MYIDTHAHFDLCAENHNTTTDVIVSLMEEHQVNTAVHVVIDTNGISWGVDFINKYIHKNIYIAFGIHPSSFADNFTLEQFSVTIAQYIQTIPDKIFGIGEAGLDYYRMRQPKTMQQNSFHFQIQLAKKHNLPIIVHSREAMEDTYTILKQYAPLKGIIHCFSGDAIDAKKFIDLGLYISFAGNITYKSATNLQEAVRYTPFDRMLLETDAPFLTPLPYRGKPNHPGMVAHTYQFVASLKKVALSNCIDNIAQNFFNLLNKQ